MVTHNRQHTIVCCPRALLIAVLALAALAVAFGGCAARDRLWRVRSSDRTSRTRRCSQAERASHTGRRST
jgi:hypothetical protein